MVNLKAYILTAAALMSIVTAIPPPPPPPTTSEELVVSPYRSPTNMTFEDYGYDPEELISIRANGPFIFDGPDYEWYAAVRSCRNDAVIARAKWRAECRYHKHGAVFRACQDYAPSPWRCCHRGSLKGGWCKEYWPTVSERAICRGWLPDLEFVPTYTDTVCRCLWDTHCATRTDE